MYEPGSEVFVFGSNLAGRHGRGAALAALLGHGAVYGVGEGHTGRAYAIPTKDEQLVSRSLSEIAESVARFTVYARSRPELKFMVTRIGCGLAGYRDTQIAPMFLDAWALPNVKLPVAFEGVIASRKLSGA